MTSGERKIARLKKLVADINNDIKAITKLAINIRTLLEEIKEKSGPVSDRDMMFRSPADAAKTSRPPSTSHSSSLVTGICSITPRMPPA